MINSYLKLPSLNRLCVSPCGFNCCPPLSSLPLSPYLSFRCFLGPSLRHRFCSPQCPRRPLLLPLPSAALAALAAATSSADPWSISLFSDLSCRSRSSIWKSRGNISVEAFQLGRPRKERPPRPPDEDEFLQFHSRSPDGEGPPKIQHAIFCFFALLSPGRFGSNGTKTAASTCPPSS